MNASLVTWQATRVNRRVAVVEVILAATLLFAPMMLGSTEAWSQQIVIGLMASALLVLAFDRLVMRSMRVVWSWAYVPIAGFVALVLLQVVPLPAGLVSLISPQTLALRKELLVGVGEAQAGLDWVTLSFYPHATLVDLRLLFIAVVGFVVALNVVKSREQMAHLMWGLVVSGVGVVSVGLYQSLVGPIAMFESGAHDRAGPFLNYGHFAQYVNITLGAALGLLLLELAVIQEQRMTFVQVMRTPEGRVHRVRVGVLAGYIVVAAVAILLSMSRGGVLSMVVASGVVGVYFAWRSGGSSGGRGGGRTPRSLMLMLGLLVFCALLAVGFDLVFERLSTLADLDRASGGRGDILRDLVPAWQAFPLLGVGLGTFSYMFTLYDQGMVARITTHAENEYAQLLFETGLVGLALAVIFVAWIFRRLIQATWTPRRGTSWAGIGLGYSFLAVLGHSFTDFGQHVPALALGFAVVCGLICRTGRWASKDQGQPGTGFTLRRASRPLRYAGFAVLVLSCGGWMWVAEQARMAERLSAQASRLAARVSVDVTQASDQQLIEVLTLAEAAVAAQPRNAESLYALNIYRWYALSRVVDEETGDLVLGEEEVAFTRQLLDELGRVRSMCPAHGSAALFAGQLAEEVFADPVGLELVQLGQRLAPYDPRATMLAARQAWRSGDRERALMLWRRLAVLDPNRREMVMRRLIEDLKVPQEAMEIARGDRKLLGKFANLLGDSPEHVKLAAEARQSSWELLQEAGSQPQADAETLASLGTQFARRGQHKEAVLYLQRAVAQNYGQVEWRIRLAESLVETGQSGQALREAQICLRLRPGMAKATRLVDRLADVVETRSPS